MIVAMLVSFTVILHAFVIDNAFYIPMLVVLFLSPFLLLTKKPQVVDLKDVLLLLLAVFMVIAASRHASSFRLSTIVFSCLYMTAFAYYKRLLPVSGLKCETYIKLLEAIIIAYAVVLFIQQLSVLIGLPVFNLSYGHFSEDSKFKQGSLAIEASSSGPVLSVLVFSLLKIYESAVGRKVSIAYILKRKKLIAVSFIYVCIASLSVTCIVSLFLILIYLVPKNRLIIGFGVCFVIFMAIYFSPNFISGRIRSLVPAILSMNAEEIYRTDPSASARIAPYLVFFSDINILDPDFWLGNGCDYGSIHVFSEITGSLQDKGMGVGGLTSFIYDYGFLSFILFAAFLCACCRENKYAIFMFVAEFFVCPLNHYSIWLFFLIIVSTSFFQRKVACDKLCQ